MSTDYNNMHYCLFLHTLYIPWIHGEIEIHLWINVHTKLPSIEIIKYRDKHPTVPCPYTKEYKHCNDIDDCINFINQQLNLFNYKSNRLKVIRLFKELHNYTFNIDPRRHKI